MSDTIVKVDEEWDVIGKEEAKVTNNPNTLIKHSPIFEIFGGLYRDEITVEKR